MAKAKLAIVLYPPVYYAALESNIEDITTSKPLTVQLISMNLSSQSNGEKICLPN